MKPRRLAGTTLIMDLTGPYALTPGQGLVIPPHLTRVCRACGHTGPGTYLLACHEAPEPGDPLVGLYLVCARCAGLPPEPDLRPPPSTTTPTAN